MEVSTKRRKKPKKADFIYKGTRYWVESAEYYLFWNGEYDTSVIYNVLEYETDKNVGDDDELNYDEEFQKKSYEVCCRMIPYDEYVFAEYLS
jgi:hypothetical protein